EGVVARQREVEYKGQLIYPPRGRAVPYKAILKSGAPRKRPKPRYRVANARAYHQSLKRRGQLGHYCPEGDLKALFVNGRPYVPGAPRPIRTPISS
ncbi:hypothetical protein, partial [Burkholderia ubonensis]|uniref:hypothetical protein n=2 Tax=Burkholderia ubonensis TaxID=101571 RepID=UPI000B160C6C